MERTSIVKLLRPMRAFKVKFPRTVCDPGAIREQGGWVFPIGPDSAIARDVGTARVCHLGKLGAQWWRYPDKNDGECCKDTQPTSSQEATYQHQSPGNFHCS